MKLILPGGSGHIGRLLVRHLAHDHDLVVLARRPERVRLPASARVVAWDGRSPGPWVAELEGADAVVNLAGRSVDCRYGPANRREILDSRVLSTRAVGEAIAACERPPAVWLQMSTATIYAHRHDAPNDEATGLLGGSEPDAPDTWRFSIDVARSWERCAERWASPATRLVLLRTAMVMDASPGGPFAALRWLVRLALGGRVGDGRQYFSWIHGADFVRALLFLIEEESLAGPVNLASPGPLPQAEFLRVLRRGTGHFLGLPTPRWLLEVGAFCLRTESELVLKSRRVVPGRLLDAGFAFRFPDWADAVADLHRGVHAS